MSHTPIATFVPDVELVACEEEPIHIPGCIQDYGVLLVLSLPSLRILQVSANSDRYLGMAAANLLEQTIEVVLQGEPLEMLRAQVSPDKRFQFEPLRLSLSVGENLHYFLGYVYPQPETVILELEHFPSPPATDATGFCQRTKAAISRLEMGADVLDLCQLAAREIRQISGFDRVMIYRFDVQGNGEVVAEDKPDEMEPYVGLHYPAADIPARARQLFQRNALRAIPDIERPPAPIVPLNNPLTDEPLDLSDTLLRGVSPIHIRYLQNMGVRGSMTIPLLKRQQLWGLVACHHRTPKVPTYEARTTCELLAKVLSLGLAAQEGARTYEYRIDLKSTQTQLLELMSATSNWAEGLLHGQPNLLNLFGASGAAICQPGRCEATGQTPSVSQIEALVSWIATQTPDPVFQTDALCQVYADAEAYREIASGVLAIALSNCAQTYLLWFRPEVVQTVNWAGDPHKNLEVEVKSEGLYWHPRASFALWQEIVRGKSIAWEPYEVEAAMDLREAILQIVLKRADELAKLNERLQQSNQDLDAFAYIASHDLKEPLRGLHNYSHFLLEDYADVLQEDGVAKLQTMIRLTQRMEDLLDSLLYYSRLDRTELSVQTTDLNEILTRVLEMLGPRIEETQAEIRIPRALPTVYCDRVRVGEVFGNLIANAIKYNDRLEKWVEIGFLDSTEPTVFYVRDNGIGIREKYIEKVFQIFKRLHGPKQYGGGTGAGLTIVKKLVERHGGRVWVESEFQQGSSFYFTLSGESWQ